MASVPRVLFLCSANSARSIMAEALLRTLGGGRFKAFSAGSHPAGRVHPFAIEALARNGCDVIGLRSKAWSEFTGPGARPMDYVITVCDSAADEACPVFPGAAVRVRWAVPDPAAVQGSDEERRRAFGETLATLRRRIQHFTGLPFESVHPAALQGLVRAIGES